MKIWALSREEAEKENVAGDLPHAIVSFTDPVTKGALCGLPPGATREAELAVTEATVDIFRLAFDDFHGEVFTDSFRLTYGRDVVFFTAQDAARLTTWLRSVLLGLGGIIFHCEAGVSRSVGAAAAVADHYGYPFEEDVRGYRARAAIGNPLVYWLMRDALRR